LCLGWTYLKNGHVRIELLSERMPTRKQAWIELIGISLFLMPYVAAIIMFGMDYVGFSYQFNEGSASPTGLPNRWIIKSAIVLGFIVLGLAAIARLLEVIVYVFGTDQQKEQTTLFKPEAKHIDTPNVSANHIEKGLL
jgi:TRAP-type mannitol/chloroaromatic compound transport system permease small subunit